MMTTLKRKNDFQPQQFGAITELGPGPHMNWPNFRFRKDIHPQKLKFMWNRTKKNEVM